MKIKAIHSKGTLDLSNSSVRKNNLQSPQTRLNLSMEPGEIIEIDDSFRSLDSIDKAIKNGNLKILNFDDKDGSYVVQSEVKTLDNKIKLLENTVDEINNIPSSRIIYLDPNRTDNYTEVGSSLFPFKTIQKVHDYLLGNLPNQPVVGGTVGLHTFVIQCQGGTVNFFENNGTPNSFAWTIPQVVIKGSEGNDLGGVQLRSIDVQSGTNYEARIELDHNLLDPSFSFMELVFSELQLLNVKIDQKSVPLGEPGEVIAIDSCWVYGVQYDGRTPAHHGLRIRNSRISDFPSGSNPVGLLLNGVRVFVANCLFNRAMRVTDAGSANQNSGFPWLGLYAIWVQVVGSRFDVDLEIVKEEEDYDGNDASGYLFMGANLFGTSAKVDVTGTDNAKVAVFYDDTPTETHFGGSKFDLSTVKKGSDINWNSSDSGVYSRLKQVLEEMGVI